MSGNVAVMAVIVALGLGLFCAASMGATAPWEGVNSWGSWGQESAWQPEPAWEPPPPPPPSRSTDSIDRMTVSDVLRLAGQWKLALLAVASALILLALWVADVIRPGGLQKSGLRDVKPHRASMWLFAGALVFLTLLFSYPFIQTQGWLTGGDPRSVRGQATILVGASLLAGVLGVALVSLFARTAPAAGLKVQGGDILIGLVCLALAWPIIELTASGAVAGHAWITKQEPAGVAHPTLELIIQGVRDASVWAWVLIAAAVLIVPIVEEIIYRVFLQSALLRWFGSPWPAILVTGVIFAAVHYKGVDESGAEIIPYYALAPLLVLGVAMGVAYEKTRRLGVPIAMHMGFNAANVYFALRVAGAA
jgi:membrane protease YdiL (CAAX protease family)